MLRSPVTRQLYLSCGKQRGSDHVHQKPEAALRLRYLLSYKLSHEILYCLAWINGVLSGIRFLVIGVLDKSIESSSKQRT